MKLHLLFNVLFLGILRFIFFCCCYALAIHVITPPPSRPTTWKTWKADLSIPVSESCAELRRDYPETEDLQKLFTIPENPGDNKLLAFLHIPKNAGTALSTHFGRFRVDENFYNKTVHRACTPWHLPPRYWVPSNPYAGRKVYCVLRHPVEKVISEFKMRSKPGELNGPNVLKNLDLFLKRKQYWDTGGIDCHMVPQYVYVWDQNGTSICLYELLLTYFNKPTYSIFLYSYK
jgi:hypothetical protein